MNCLLKLLTEVVKAASGSGPGIDSLYIAFQMLRSNEHLEIYIW